MWFSDRTIYVFINDGSLYGIKIVGLHFFKIFLMGEDFFRNCCRNVKLYSLETVADYALGEWL